MDTPQDKPRLEELKSLRMRDNSGRKAPLASAVEFHVDFEYFRSILASCINTKSFGGIGKAMEVICGLPKECQKSDFADYCVQACLDSLGTPMVKTGQMVKVAFITDYLESREARREPLKTEHPVQRCDESRNGVPACTCVDCVESCGATPYFLRRFKQQWMDRRGERTNLKSELKQRIEKNNPESSSSPLVYSSTLHRLLLEEESVVFGYPWIAVILFTLSFIAVLLLIAFCFLCDTSKRKRRTLDEKETIKFAGTYWGLRDRFDNLQRGGAQWYAEVVADHTCAIGCLTIAIVTVIMAVGLPMQKFIVDPMDVWTEANSRARVEKSRFDTLFKPMPRYTQVIMKPLQTFDGRQKYGPRMYGPIFNDFVFQHAYHLTDAILNMTGKKNEEGIMRPVGLGDVCQKLVNDECFIISPLSYFQNNGSLLHCVRRFCSPTMEDETKKKLEEKTIIPSLEDGKDRMWYHAEVLLELGQEKDQNDIFDPSSMEGKEGESSTATPVVETTTADVWDMKRRKREIIEVEKSEYAAELAAAAAQMRIDSAKRYEEQSIKEGFGWFKHLMRCIDMPLDRVDLYSLECGSQMDGAPVPANMVFGGWMSGPKNLSEAQQIVEYSNAFVLTIGLDAEKKEEAEIWEKAVIDHLKKYASDYLEVTYVTQVSIQEEINEAAQSDVRIVAIGYILMALYIVIGLSQFSPGRGRGMLRHTLWHHILPGFMVSLTIALSVLSVMAVYGMMGVRATLMCLEVQPFLMCAIGVNNVFYFVKTYQRKMHDRRKMDEALLSPMIRSCSIEASPLPMKKERASEEREKEMERVERIMTRMRREVLVHTCERVLPSMFCTAFTECVAFLSLGLSSAPVLKVFSFYSSAGVIANFLFTLTIFVPAFFFAMKYSAMPTGVCSPVDCVPREREEMRRRTRRKFDQIRSSRGWMPHLIEKYYAPIIFTRKGRYSTIMVQFLLIATSIVFIPQLPIGLDEKMSVPKESYVYKFMESLPFTLSTSMPVHFVVYAEDGVLPMREERFMKLLCSLEGCAENSLPNLIDAAMKVTNNDLISAPLLNWADDFTKFRQISNTGKSCCVYNQKREEYCTYEEVTGRGEEMGANATDYERFDKCSTCIRDTQNAMVYNMTRDLHQFSRLLPTKNCGMNGGMAHREALSLTRTGHVKAFYTRAFHKVFSNSSDYIDGLKLSRAITGEFKRVLDLNGYTDVQVFPYSFYYVYYDQYLFIAFSTTSQLALSAGIAFIALTMTTVSPTTALIVALNTLSATLLLVGYMVIRGIELNALTIVNLAMSLGMDLEFFAHLCFAYANSGRVDRIERATDALVNVGSTIFSGIVCTKFIGLLVLYNAQSQIFKTYYFDFYLGLLPIGTIHGLLFLPVLLTFWGPDTYLRRYVEQNEKSGEHGTDEGRLEATSSHRSLVGLPSQTVKSGSVSSRSQSTYGRVAAAISPAATQLTTHSGGSNSSSATSMASSHHIDSSPSVSYATAPSTVDHESAPLVVRLDQSITSQDDTL